MAVIRYAFALGVVALVLGFSFEALTLDGAPLSATAEMTHSKACKDHHLG
jgi:hypothetical protein